MKKIGLDPRSMRHALRNLSESSCGLADVSDETAVLGHICRIAVATGEHSFAWIGLCDEGPGRTLRASAQAGEGSGFLGHARPDSSADEIRLGPTAAALQSGKTCLVADIRLEAEPSVWRSLALRSGFFSATAIPLRDEGRVAGVLSVYASRPGAFSANDVILLEKIAQDVSFGIRTLRRRSALRRAETQTPSPGILSENPRDGIFVMDERGLNYVNFAFEVLSGYSASELCGTGFDLVSIILPEPGVPPGETGQGSAKNSQAPLFLPELRLRTKDGYIRTVENNTLILPGPRRRILGLMRDITDRKQNESDLHQWRGMLDHTLGLIVQNIGRAFEAGDAFRTGHQLRVTELAQAIARELFLPRKQRQGLLVASLLHDIGLGAVPAEVLSKPGGLSVREIGLVKKHPTRGYELLKPVKFPWPVAQIVLQHHEQIDGSGYPDGLSADRILLEAKILRLADAVEAMSSPRAYRPALAPDRIMEEITRGRGVRFDGQAVEACRRLFETKGFRFPLPDGALSAG